MTLEEHIDASILALSQGRGPDKSICPSEVAKAVGAERAQDWHTLMQPVRRAAVKLALSGRIAILRKGKPADPRDFKGVYRLQATRED